MEERKETMVDKNLMKDMKELTRTLAEAARAYYRDNREIMSNFEYDALYDKLLRMEEETGIVLAGSPTLRIGYELSDDLPKEDHEKVMLSLDKTKDKDALVTWLGNNKGLLSWKLDGITLVLTYEDGVLDKAVTRGNGSTGEVVTNNARVFVNIPLKIPYKGRLIVRGEAVIGYRDFERINRELSEGEEKYKNPRNLCSGSVRQLNNEVTARRSVHFYAFGLVEARQGAGGGASPVDFQNSRKNQLEWLRGQGFEMVAYKEVTSENLVDALDGFSDLVEGYDFPTDGLVLTFDDISYGESLGATAKFPRDAIAFKWQDEIKETVLLEIEWSPSRTGQINPIAIFEPVELEGTTVKRASLHNISIMEDLKLGLGDEITVYKANMIIPQVAENLTRSARVHIPDQCPACGQSPVVKEENEVKVLYCVNEDCPAKHIKSYTHFVSRDAMGIDGLSEATIEKFISKGFIKEFADIFSIDKHKDQIIALEGFGEKSYEKLWQAIQKSKKTTAVRLLYSLGIANIGLTNAKAISNYFDNDWGKIQAASFEDLTSIHGVGTKMAEAYLDYFGKDKNKVVLEDLLQVVDFQEASGPGPGAGPLAGVSFVITGSLELFKNRKELKEYIESLGGLTGDTVNKETNYLINNDINSPSSKNRKAKELGIEIIGEDQFNALLKEYKQE